PHPRVLHSFPTRRSSDLNSSIFVPLKFKLFKFVNSPILSGNPSIFVYLKSNSSRFVNFPILSGNSSIFALLKSNHLDSLTPLYRSEEHTSELQSRFDLVC